MEAQLNEPCVCQHCGEKFATLKDGKIPTHDFPRPCRQVCRGSGLEPKSDNSPLGKYAAFVTHEVTEADILKATEADVKVVLDSLMSTIDKERRASQPYREMFEASRHGLRGLLSKAEHSFTKTSLDLYQVFEDIGIAEGKQNELWDAIRLLPYLYRKARADISAKEGSSFQ